MTYFISIDEIKQNNVINANVDTEYIEPALREAQDVYLREIIGDALYNAIESRINDDNLTDQYSVLVEQYIKPYLENRMLASLVIPLSMKIRNAGVIQQYDQGFNSSNVKDVAYLADYYNNRVEFYENRMTEYLKKNSADFPEYGYSSENITNPSQTHTAGTIYLGGGRKRPCGLKTGSGGGSTDSVEWNDIQNKPDFAEVATSGSYNDLEDTPEIPTVNDATINIYQGNTLKGSFSLNQENGQNIDLEAGGSGSTDWNDIQNKPDFAPVATSGSYNDLSDIPYYFNYLSLNMSSNGVKLAGQTQFDELTTDITYGVQLPFKVDAAQIAKVYTDYIITGENTGGASELIIEGDDGGNVYGKITKDGIYEGTDKLSDKYLQITNLPTNVSAFTNDAGYLTQHQSLAGYATETWVQQQGYSTFSGSYNDLSDKPTIPAAQIQSDWNASTGVAQILNKPTIPTKTSELTNDSGFTTFDGDYNSLTNKPTIPAAQVQSDWNENDNTSLAYIQNKPSIPAAQVQSDWNANSGMGEILNKPSMTAETWTFELSGGTTVTKTVWLQ